MTNTVSFFYNQEKDSGETAAFRVIVAGSYVDFYIYYKNLRVDASNLFRDNEFQESSRYKELVTQIEGILAHSDEGILVRSEEGRDGYTKVQMSRSGHRGENPKIAKLQPGYPAHFVAVHEISDVPKGTHLVIPVDADAADQLYGLVNHLRWFSRDLESLVLSNIQRPGLDSRLDRVEEEVGWIRRILRSPQNMGGRQGKIRRALHAPFAFVDRYSQPLVLIGVLLLVAQNLFLGPITNALSSSPTAAPGYTETTNNAVNSITEGNSTNILPGNVTEGDRNRQEDELTSEDPTADLHADDDHWKNAQTHIKATRELLTYLSQNHDARGELRLLWERHFRKLRGIGSVQTWLPGDYFVLFDEQNFFWGLVKLYLLSSDVAWDDLKFLGEFEWSETKTALRSDEVDYENERRSIKEMLAAIACRITYVNDNGKVMSYNGPGILSTGRGNGEFKFIEGRSCSDLSLEDTEKGLAELLERTRDLVEG